jgi:hypothetical protein
MDIRNSEKGVLKFLVKKVYYQAFGMQILWWLKLIYEEFDWIFGKFCSG